MLIVRALENERLWHAHQLEHTQPNDEDHQVQ